MHKDIYGQQIYTERELCEIYFMDPDRKVKNCLVDKLVHFDPNLEIEHIPHLIENVDLNLSVEEFDLLLQQNWKMPDEYKNLDIAKWVLDQCKTDHERQRVGEELLMYAERNLFTLLQYLKYLVDTMRKYNVIWGVGRGSSVSSYVLYLIGVHKINSMYYDLDINEFLR